MSPQCRTGSSSSRLAFSLSHPNTSSIVQRRSSRANSTSSTSSSARRTRARTAKACDRCRFKKSKCDGRQPCRRCSKDDSPCLYSSRVHVGRKASMFETLAMMSEGLEMMYKAFQEGKGFPGDCEPSGSDDTETSAHEILERLGLIKTGNEGDSQSSASPDSPKTASPMPAFGKISTSLDMSPEAGWSSTPADKSLSSNELNLHPVYRGNQGQWLGNDMLLSSFDEPYLFQSVSHPASILQDNVFQPSNDFLLQTVP